MSALSFANPAILLSLLALPVIWFLLRAVPQAPQRQIFPGLFFLYNLKDRKETPSRTPWQLLLLRLLALALVIIGIAGPILNNAERAAQNGPVVIVLDDSWAAAPKWTERQSALRTIATEIEGTDRPLWVITTSPKNTGAEEASLLGPLTTSALSSLADTIVPQPFSADRIQALKTLEGLKERLKEPADIRWLSDGIFTGDDIAVRRFARRLVSLGSVTAYRDPSVSMQPALTGVNYKSDSLEAVLQIAGPAATDLTGSISILARDGRLLTQAEYVLEQGAADSAIKIELPLILRNEIGLVRIDGLRSSGAVQLADASARRSLVGLAGANDTLSGTLLDGRFYIQQALAPYALFRAGTINELAASDTTVIILDDVGRLRKGDRDALKSWMERGGILIRFAGPTLANAAQAAAFGQADVLLPVALRGGGRAFGGALTWEEPQPLGGFSDQSPFSDLEVSPDIRIRRQVLARPGADTTQRSWAYLADGTPLVTAAPVGKGLAVLFHVTASPSWSDLPVSGLYVEMLRRLTALSITSTVRSDPDTTYVPRRVLTGFGRLDSPADDVKAATIADARQPATPAHPPGFYGSPDTPLAINTLTSETTLSSLFDIGAYDSTTSRPYEKQSPQALAKWFLLIGLLLLLTEALYTLLLQGKLLPSQKQASTIAIFVLSLMIIFPDLSAVAQPATPLDKKAVDAALNTRFAYVITGNSEIDTISRAGLNGLRLTLAKRTALEAAEPVGVNLPVDDLSVYPLIYWPILPTTRVPEETALIRLEAFMAGGGLVIFDTRDGTKVFGNQQSEEGAALRRILEQLDIPPLEPLPEGHVLRRSFYLMDDLPGRNEDGPVWVEASGAGAVGNLNDGVTPIIIGGRDWAAAWAVDDFGRSLRPMGPGTTGRRETAIRSGINMAMVALTGNYKIDQLQAEALLDLLGTERGQP